jgi:hypothetical protein
LTLDGSTDSGLVTSINFVSMVWSDGLPSAIYYWLTISWMSSRDKLIPEWVFCTKTIDTTAFTSSAEIKHVIPTHLMPSRTENKYSRWDFISGRWCTFFENVASSGICKQNLMKSTGFTSRIDSMNTSANSLTSSRALHSCSWLRWGLKRIL